MKLPSDCRWLVVIQLLFGSLLLGGVLLSVVGSVGLLGQPSTFGFLFSIAAFAIVGIVAAAGMVATDDPWPLYLEYAILVPGGIALTVSLTRLQSIYSLETVSRIAGLFFVISSARTCYLEAVRRRDLIAPPAE